MSASVGGSVAGHALEHCAGCCPRPARFTPPGPRTGRTPVQRHQSYAAGVAQDDGGARSVVCPRAACTELATYSLGAAMNTSLLESCVREAVLHLDEAPCLWVASTSYNPAFIRQPVPEAVVAVPQLWKGIGETIAGEDPELLVLVHRVPDGGSPTCLKLQLAAGRAQDTVDDAVDIWPQSSGARSALLPSGLVSGKVGDCCDEDDHHRHGDGDDTAGHQGRPDSDISFWGLVIQSRTRREMEGCYLLKTVKNIGMAGCTCTHFSVNRVCQEVPLCEQLQASWLV